MANFLDSKLPIIVNPYAKNSPIFLRTLLNSFSDYFYIYVLHNENELRNCIELILKKGFNQIVIAGGDGTFHKVINLFKSYLMIDRFPQFILLPCGTINTLFWQFYSRNYFIFDPIYYLKKLLKRVGNFRKEKLQLLQVNSIIGWLYVVGIGEFILNLYYKLEKRGFIQSFMVSFETLVKGLKEEIPLEECKIQGKFFDIITDNFLFAIASTVNYPFPFLRITKKGKETGFKFINVNIEPIRFIKYLPLLFLGNLPPNGREIIVEELEDEKLYLEFNKPLPLIIDGERYLPQRLHKIKSSGFIELLIY